MDRQHRTRGFTLLEMAIVLLVIGILLGSVVAGQYFLKTAALRSALKEVEFTTRAMQQFKTKYSYLPGDFLNAAEQWGEGVGCRVTPIPDTDPGTCNGNGNEQIDTEAENLRAWQHMSMSGMIPGNYLGTPSGGELVPGTTNPAVDIRNGMLSAFYFGVAPRTSGSAATDMTYPSDYKHVLVLGGFYSIAPYTGLSVGPIMTPEEAWHIDGKLDDQRPATGIVTSFLPTSGFNGECATTSDRATAIYKTTVSTEACSLIIKTGF